MRHDRHRVHCREGFYCRHHHRRRHVRGVRAKYVQRNSMVGRAVCTTLTCHLLKRGTVSGRDCNERCRVFQVCCRRVPGAIADERVHDSHHSYVFGRRDARCGNGGEGQRVRGLPSRALSNCQPERDPVLPALEDALFRGSRVCRRHELDRRCLRRLPKRQVRCPARRFAQRRRVWCVRGPHRCYLPVACKACVSVARLSRQKRRELQGPGSMVWQT